MSRLYSGPTKDFVWLPSLPVVTDSLLSLMVYSHLSFNFMLLPFPACILYSSLSHNGRDQRPHPPSLNTFHTAASRIERTRRWIRSSLAQAEEQTFADVAERVAAICPRHTSRTAVLSMNLICHIMSKHMLQLSQCDHTPEECNSSRFHSLYRSDLIYIVLSSLSPLPQLL